jgi:hypothetical protein
VYFALSKKGSPLFTKIHPLLAGILQAAALDPWERYPEGSARLLPSPGGDEELGHDWEDFVQPELRRNFDAERATVQADVLAMKQGRGEAALWSLEIPREHCDAWLTTLNALRLAIVSEYCLTEAELSEKGSADFSTERNVALVQVNFFAFIQECLIQAIS